MKTLYALLGTPGVGKTTFIKNSSHEIFGDDRLLRYVVGPDLIRSMVESPVEKPDGSQGISQSNERYVWNIVNEILDKKVSKGELIIVDATHSRNKAISNYKKYSDKGYRIVLVDFSDYASLEEIFQRNKTREDYKFVPEHIIETMYERIKSLDIPNWVEVIQPDDFAEHLTNVKFNWDNFNRIFVMGDIHGCVEEFKETLDIAGINPAFKDKDTALVFVGDYFDRGPGIVEVFRIMQQLQKNYFVLPLIGNHEEPLAYYKDYLHDFHEYVLDWINVFSPKKKANTIEVQQTKQTTLFERIKNKIFQKPPEIIQEIKKTIHPEIELDALKLMRNYRTSSYKHMDSFVEQLKSYPLAFESFKSLVWSYNFKDIDYVKHTSRSTLKTFLLSDITYQEIAQFHKRLAQLCYVDFHGKEIAITHGGLTKIPSKLVPTADIIRGVGEYDDALLCDQTFRKNHPEVIGIHGHRNVTDIPIQSTPSTYNINGDVDLGLRALLITKEEIKTFEVSPRKSTLEFYREKQIQRAKKLKAKKLKASEEGSGLIRLFQDHQHVDVKRLPGDIASINFTRKAFEKGVWDDITIKARGLFIAISTDNNPEDTVIARGYEKFFNLGERFGVTRRDLRQLVYPILAYEKANGYLGILSVDVRDPENPVWFIASKTTNQGDYAQHFRKMIKPSLNKDLKELMIKNNVTLLFEVIDPVFDPHIQNYEEPELVLLDAVYNQFQFEKEPYSKLVNYISLMSPQEINVREKKLIKRCNTYNELNILINQLNDVSVFEEDSVEGYVFEEEAELPTMFKVKSNWYSFWKFTRSMRDKIVNKILGDPNKEFTKSNRIKLKAMLHTAEQIKTFNVLAELAEESPEEIKKMDIPELRRKVLQSIKNTA
jgi:predicted kinase